MIPSFSKLLLFGTGLIVLSSCGGQKNLVYFNDVNTDSTITFQNEISVPEAIIQSDDIIAVTISTESSMTPTDPVSIFQEGGTPYSLSASISSTQNGSGGAAQTNSGYLVDKSGNIDFPVIGKVKVAGLTMRQAKDLFASKLKDVIKNPVVEVRILNYKVTVLGEVARPGVIIAPNQKLSIIEAIATAGDVLITGRKDNVMVIRQEEGRRVFAHLDLNSKDIFYSPYFYLRQNDIVIVAASNVRKQQNNEFLRIYLPAITSVISSTVAIYGLVKISQQ